MQHDRIVVITGAAGGIGSAIVARFLANGDTVVATDRTNASLATLSSKQGTGGKLLTISGDVSKERDCKELADFAKAKAGRVDVLVNCAGVYPVNAFEKITFEEWNHVLGVNLTGNFLVTQAFLPLLKGRGWGRIVNVGSASIFEGVAGQSHYVAAKAGLIGLSRSLAMEVGEEGITVNIVTPGLTLTKPVLEHVPAELIQSQPKLRAIKRDEHPEDLVGAVFFLASPDADFISGQILNVDGGRIKN